MPSSAVASWVGNRAVCSSTCDLSTGVLAFLAKAPHVVQMVPLRCSQSVSDMIRNWNKGGCKLMAMVTCYQHNM